MLGRRTLNNLILLIATFGASALAQSSPSANLDAIIANATAAHDTKGATRAMNLKWALSAVRPSDLNGVKCGKETAEMHFDVPAAQDLAGKLMDKGLERYLPALAAALASSAASAIAVFLTPTPIGTDAVEILNQSDKRPHSEVQGAAREMLQDPPNLFKKIANPMLAKIAACSI
jgi:hypothetical protein